MTRLLHAALLAVCFAGQLAYGQPASASPPIDMAALGKRASPGEAQKALQPLIGRWRVEKSTFVVAGTPDHPATSTHMVTERKWIGDGRFVSDVTTGLLGGKPYYRSGLLGYNAMDRRYKWTTADNQTTTMMSYRGAAGSGDAFPAVMQGEFTDLGITGEANVGKTVPMRTSIAIESKDRVVYELYFTPPGKPEMLADRMVFERIR